MSSRGSQRAIIQHNGIVGFFQNAYPVGDNKQTFNRVVVDNLMDQESFGICINSRKDIIKNEQFAFRVKSPGKTNPLLLTAR